MNQKLTLDEIDEHIAIVVEALKGGRGHAQQQIAEQGIRLVTTLLQKNHDYGNTVFDCPYLTPGVKPSDAILVRMSDKVSRLENLARQITPEVDESFEDTMTDLAGYAILYLVTK